MLFDPRLRLLLLISCFAVALVSAQQARPPLVNDVRTVNLGPGPLDESSVLAFVGMQPGRPFDPMLVNRDVRDLLETGRFSDVTVSVEIIDDASVDVIYEIRNRPRLRSITIDGAEHVSNRRVRDWLGIAIGDRVDDHLLAVRAHKVREEYRKRFFLSTDIQWELDVNEQTGAANLRLHVQEGDRARIGRIQFEGNEAIGSATLRRRMTSKNWRPWARLTKRNRFDPALLDADRDILRRVFMEQGLLDVRVGDPVIEPVGRNRINIEIPIEEGPLYRIEAVEFSGVELFPEVDLQRALFVGPSDVARLDRIEMSRQAIRHFYGSRGFIRTRVRERLEPDFDEATVTLQFGVTEGELSRVRDVHITGNMKTRDKVIRRELAIMPGDIYDEVRVRRSETRLRNLGYFDSVRVADQPTIEPNLYDLTFDVVEGRTGELQAGVGFSSIDRVVGFASIAQNNFDLMGWPRFTGGGQRTQLMGSFGSRKTDVDFSFVEPWFLDRQLEYRLTLFRRDARYFRRLYEQRSVGGNTGFTWPVGRFSRLSLLYGLQQIEIRNVEETASAIIQEEEGKLLRSSMTMRLTRDTRDRFFIPTRGNRLSASLEVAGGPFGADVNNYNVELRGSQYFPLWYGHVLSFRGIAAVVEEFGSSDRVPIFDRLFLGGMRDVRGFRLRDVGPKDENQEPIGGRSSAFASAEYTVPVFAMPMRLAGFYDIGMVWEDAYEFRFNDLNSSVGLGIRFDFPQFPLRFDYAWPLETDEFNDRRSARFSFMLGHVY